MHRTGIDSQTLYWQRCVTHIIHTEHKRSAAPVRFQNRSSNLCTVGYRGQRPTPARGETGPCVAPIFQVEVTGFLGMSLGQAVGGIRYTIRHLRNARLRPSHYATLRPLVANTRLNASRSRAAFAPFGVRYETIRAPTVVRRVNATYSPPFRAS